MKPVTLLCIVLLLGVGGAFAGRQDAEGPLSSSALTMTRLAASHPTRTSCSH
ncbi:MAG: hypothetical protein JW850_19090 [Thermoflexales bacterium]|nr:hypothetical protein [Thermoflexales bacterium]